MKKLLLLLAFQCLGANEEAQNLHRFIMANYKQSENDLKNAQEWYNQITPEHASEYIYIGYLPFLSATQSYAQLVQLIPTLGDFYKKNLDTQLIYANALEQVGKKNEAHTLFVTLNEQNKTNQEIAFKTVQVLLERSEPENAIKVIDNFLNKSPRRPNNYIFHFLKAQVHLQLNNKKDALLAIRHCIDTYPKFDKSWLLYAALQEQEGKLEEAIKGYTTFLEMTPGGNSQIEQHLLGLAFRQKLSQKMKPDNDPLFAVFALVENKEYGKALHATDAYLDKQPSNIQARILKIQILIAQNNMQSAARLLAQWVEKETDTQLWLKALHLLSYLGFPLQNSLQILSALEKKKSSLDLLLYQADIALRLAQDKVALSALQKAYSLAKDPLLKNQIALQLGMLYHDSQSWDPAIKILEEATKLSPYAPNQNLLAYIYTTKRKNVSRADTLIQEALKHDPDNPHFLDTQALILYKQGKFDQANQVLQKVASVCPTDFTVLRHLGKCYAKQGKQDKAIQTFAAAREIAKNDFERNKAELLISKLKR